MCIIMICNEKPTDKILEEANRLNSDGAGIAYRENNEVHWQKGLNLREIKKYTKELPLPYIVHFRIATIGGRVSELTHPFPVTADSPNWLAGKTKGSVLFHNGTYRDFYEDIFNYIKDKKITTIEPLQDHMSDTRALAMISALHKDGHKVLDKLHGMHKFVIFNPAEIIKYGFFHKDTKLDIEYSNLQLNSVNWQNNWDNNRQQNYNHDQFCSRTNNQDWQQNLKDRGYIEETPGNWRYAAKDNKKENKYKDAPTHKARFGDIDKEFVYVNERWLLIKDLPIYFQRKQRKCKKKGKIFSDEFLIQALINTMVKTGHLTVSESTTPDPDDKDELTDDDRAFLAALQSEREIEKKLKTVNLPARIVKEKEDIQDALNMDIWNGL